MVHDSRLSVSLDKIINPDNYARGLSSEITDPVERYRIAMDSCEAIRRQLLSQGVSFGFEIVEYRQDKLDFVREAKSCGYFVDLIFVTTRSPELCYERVRERVALGGHDVPRDKVFSRFERTMGYLHEYLEMADHADVWDNSGDHLVLAMSKDDGTVRLTEDGRDLEWVRKYLPDLF